MVHGAAGAVKEFASEARVVAYGQGSVKELFDKISAADLVIAPDSFALHLASFYDVPAIGYFGPAYPHRFRPTGPGSSSLFHQPECSPCLQLRGNSSLPQRVDPMQFAGGDEAGRVCRRGASGAGLVIDNGSPWPLFRSRLNCTSSRLTR